MSEHIHDVGLVDSGDTRAAVGLSVVECVARNTLRSIRGDELDRLDYAIDNLEI